MEANQRVYRDADACAVRAASIIARELSRPVISASGQRAATASVLVARPGAGVDHPRRRWDADLRRKVLARPRALLAELQILRGISIRHVTFPDEM